MEVREYIQLLRRWWWLLLLGVFLAAGSAYLISQLQEPVYRATATLLVSEGDVGQATDFSGLQTSERLAQSYVERLSNYEVLATAVDNLNLVLDPADLEENLQVRLVGNTQLIELSVEHPSPGTAQALANEIPQVFAARNSEQQLERFAESKATLRQELDRLETELDEAEAALAQAEAADAPAGEVEQLRDNVLRLRDTHSQLLQTYENVRVAEASSLNNIIIDEPARRPVSPVRPRTLYNTILAAVLGGLAAGGFVFFLDYLDDSVRQPEELERLAGLSTLGTIPRLEAADPAEALVVLRTPRAPAAEAYRQLRTNLMYALVDGRLQSILVTSSGAGEGKTTTAANLALALMQLDKRVILVDSDLRRPMLHTLFGLSNSRGLSTLFVSDDPGRRLLQPVGPGRLRVLTAGPLPPNPAELLGTERMAAIAASLAKGADYVVYDSPPLLAVTDAAVLSRQADATLLVVEAGRTAAPTLQQAAAQLRAVEANLAGAVLNRVGPGRGYYHYYNGYYKRWEEAVAAPDGNGNGVLERLRRRALQERVLPFPSRISLIV